MADPPPYEESASEYSYPTDSKPGSKGPQRFSIRAEVDTSRSQHVSALVSKLLPQVKERARRGLSKTTLLLLPSNQGRNHDGELVGFPQDELPIIVQLEGRIDTVEFWVQQEALDQLQRQMLAAVSNDLPVEKEELPSLKQTGSTKSSFFSKKQAKAAEIPDRSVTRPSVRVETRFDEAYFRSENAFGLYETLRSKCVLLVIDVR